MDTIPESAVRTFLRIELLLIQGSARAIILALTAIFLIPIAPFILAVSRLLNVGMPWWKRVVLLPAWVVLGFLISIGAPMAVFGRGIADTLQIVAHEWKMRWRYGVAKFPDGRPMPIPSPEQEAMEDVAITKSVVEDYNEEAQMFGQGIPPIE